MEKLVNIQKTICNKYGAEFLEYEYNEKIGISDIQNDLPIHWVRINPEWNTSWWYLWTWEYSEDNDFFTPLCIWHIEEEKQNISKFLWLAPGWRFLIDANWYEDVWFDKSVLEK